jgi:hypothetical protein
MSAWVAVLVWIVTFTAVVIVVNRALDAWEARWQRRHDLDEVKRRDAAREAMRRWHEEP